MHSIDIDILIFDDTNFIKLNNSIIIAIFDIHYYYIAINFI
jgi:hypothetical protein